MRKHRDANQNDQLDDEDLLQREASERREFLRLEGNEHHLGDTTYGAPSGSTALIHAWERWNRTRLAVGLRGLLPRLSA